MDPSRKAIENLVSAERVVRSALPEDDKLLVQACRPGSWSPAEHALHCALVNEMVAARFQEILDGNDCGPPTKDLKKSMIRRLVLTTWFIPEGRPAPEPVKPLVILPRVQLLKRLLSARDEMVALVDCAKMPRNKLWTEHPVLGPLSFSEWVTFIQIHSQHHSRLISKQSKTP